jgi:exodeoxyribonuclease VII large subunit
MRTPPYSVPIKGMNDPQETFLRVWSVGALLRAVSNAIDGHLNPVAITGELSGFTRAASGHCYFSLKDEQGQIRCAMFRRAAGLVDFTPSDGQRVEVRGRLGIYEQRGELQLVAESMQKAGEGDLFREFVALKAKLETEGLFDPARKRPLPRFPRAIGVVTSLDGAALHDVVHTLQRRVPHIPVQIYPSGVQGAQAASELCDSLLQAGNRREVDLLLLVRGGGSMEDLWAFNDERLARVIAGSPVPVISGVGHETDFTIADFCADLRAPTPTAAAELCAPPLQALALTLAQTGERLTGALTRHLQSHAQRLDWAASRVGQPSHLVTRQQSRLAAASHALRQLTISRLEREAQRGARLALDWPTRLKAALRHQQHRLERSQFRLAVLDPKLILQRGYVWLSDAQGTPVTHAGSISVGQALRATLVDGEVDLTAAAIRPR